MREFPKVSRSRAARAVGCGQTDADARVLGRPPEQVFASIEEQPLASASIAQVYAVTVTDGGVTHDLVVKVQRRNLPGACRRRHVDAGVLCGGAGAFCRACRDESSSGGGAVSAEHPREGLDSSEASRMEEFNRIMAGLVVRRGGAEAVSSAVIAMS